MCEEILEILQNPYGIQRWPRGEFKQLKKEKFVYVKIGMVAHIPEQEWGRGGKLHSLIMQEGDMLTLTYNSSRSISFTWTGEKFL